MGEGFDGSVSCTGKIGRSGRIELHKDADCADLPIAQDAPRASGGVRQTKLTG